MPSKIYTGGGDRGKTSLLSGRRVEKDDPRVEAYGALDELQAHLGTARALMEGDGLSGVVLEVQKHIFTICAELSWEGPREELKNRLDEGAVVRLEGWIDGYTDVYSLPKRFVVPGACGKSAALHVARTVCRRCERLIVGVNRERGDLDLLLVYVNRLSDLLFVLAWGTEMTSIIEDVVLETISPDEK